MSYSINTNIASLQAQEYLRTTSDFQAKTINRVTSGLRIISSGDDAAGLAIANGYRSDRSVLTQGVRNANDGLSTLQTIDGGMNNISMLLDRARTLAAQSASGTFNGDRSLLNSEFSSVITEVDRQAKAIGLDTGGDFAKSLAVFIGGGRNHAGEASTEQITNGSVSVDLTNSTVDAKSLGLKGMQAIGVTGTDIGTGAASTSVQAIVEDTANKGSLATAGFTEFTFYGAGFSDNDKVGIAVNLSGITDTDTLVAAINNAIDTAGNGTTAAATAFQNAGVRASVNTDANGKKQLTFASSDGAFQVRAEDRMANALMGNYTSSSNPAGKSLAVTYTGGVVSGAGAGTWAANASILVRFQGAGLSSPVDLTVSVTATTTTVTQAIADLQTQVANNATLKAAGITMTGATAGSALVFTNSKGEKFDVLVAGDIENELGLGSFRKGGASNDQIEYTTITAGAGTYTDTQTLEFVIGGQAKVQLSLADYAGVQADALEAINAAIASNATLSAAGLKASAVDATHIKFDSTNGTHFRLNAVAQAASDAFGFGSVGVAYTANTATTLGHDATFNSGGAANTALGTNNDVFAWSQLNNGDEDQTITVSAPDSTGADHSMAIVLKKDSLSAAGGMSGRTLDEAINYINAQLQQSNDATLNKVVAVKEVDHANSAEGVRFLGSLGSFKVSVGTNSGAVGITDAASGGPTQGAVIASETASGGSVADISTRDNAQTAVTLLASAVATLGSAQAVVGKGQNNFTYAVSLAQTQLNNLAASESRIRDADLANEAANLTKAQILQQAGIAALAQANVAPQAVLTLLRG